MELPVQAEADCMTVGLNYLGFSPSAAPDVGWQRQIVFPMQQDQLLAWHVSMVGSTIPSWFPFGTEVLARRIKQHSTYSSFQPFPMAQNIAAGEKQRLSARGHWAEGGLLQV